jgi:beta-glucosidase
MKVYSVLLFLSTSICLYAMSSCNTRADVQALTDHEIEQRVAELLAKMTIEEKVAQMRIFHAQVGIELDDNKNLLLSDNARERMRYGIAGIKNPGEHYSPEEAAIKNNLLQKHIIENTRLGIPAMFVTEAYSGVDAKGTTKFARPINQAATFNPDLVHDVWYAIGREARVRGMHMCHSPEADIMRDPRFGRMSEGFSEDTHLTTRMVVSAVTGVQGDYQGLSSSHIGAVTKHFVAYGQVEGGRNFASIQVSPRVLNDQMMPPFKAAVQEAKTLGIMASHGDINGIASHGNRELLTGILREQWGFDGYTVSDSNDIARLHYFMGVAETPDDAALMGLHSGVNVDLYADDSYAYLPRLAKQYPHIVSEIDHAVSNVLRTKFRLGLFDHPYTDPQQAASITRSDAHLDLAKDLAQESIILLKNHADTLPVDTEKLNRVALVGPLLDSHTEKVFVDAFGKNTQVVAEKGFELTDENPNVPQVLDEAAMRKGLKKALKVAKKADIVFAFVGGDEFTAKEAYFNSAYGDRANLHPVGLQDELVTSLKEMGKTVVVVLKHRRTLAVNTFAEYADAILDAWDAGEMANEALVSHIVGESVPSGKLPVTVPRSVGQLPFHYSQMNINFKKGYLFEKDGPLYPFGFGLSYVEFEYDGLSISETELPYGGTLQVSVNVTNTGTRAAKEVVQVYVQDVIGTVLRPQQELKAFRKVHLNAGETQTLSFNITPEMLAYTRKDMSVGYDAGQFIVRVGGSSKDTLSTSFRVLDEKE